MTYIRHKIAGNNEDNIIKLITEYGITVLENAFFTLLVVRYILVRSWMDVNFITSVQFFEVLRCRCYSRDLSAAA